jgi:pyruvate dehydrogenase E1 component alpha subunit
MWMQGYPLELLVAGRTGDERGGSPPEGVMVLPSSITVGGHMVHAVGLAWAERIKANDRIAITYFGDGATSEGDFHEAMNFAAVFEVGCVFFCQNNGWAISMPRTHQTAS